MSRNHYSLALFAASVAGLGSGLSAPVFSQELSEIIVTARRVEERLQDVPISITVFNQEALDKGNVQDLTDLARLVPSLASNNKFGGQTATFSIRGFEQEGRTAPAVGIYFGEVVTPRSPAALSYGGDAFPGYMFDLQNVQVLNGPQGTLFGRNTTGGSIILVPQKPTSELEGYVEGSYGNYDMERLQGVLNLPISSNLRLRVGADWMTRDGYVHNISGIGPSRMDDVNYYALRASLVGDVTPNLENYTIAQFSNSNTVPADMQVFAVDPTKPIGGLLLPQYNRFLASGNFYTVENDVTNPREFVQVLQLQNITTWHATDLLTVKNIASYSYLRQDIRQDLAGTNVSFGPLPFYFFTIIPAPGTIITDQKSITEELQLQGQSGDHRLQWQAGLYYEGSDPRQPTGSFSPSFAACTNLPNGCFNVGFGPPASTRAVGTQEFRTYAGYAQSTYALQENLKLTAGVRYTYDTVKSTGTWQTFGYDAAGNLLPPTCIPGIPVSLPDCLLRAQDTSHAPTWLLDLEYKPTDDMMTYVKYSRGYRQGMANAFIPPGINTWQPEKVDLYEIGAKSSWQGAVPGLLDGAVFYNKFTNQQIDVGLSCAPGNLGGCTPGQGVVNAGKSTLWGVELQGQIRPVESFRLDFNGTYLATKIDRITVPAAPPPFASALPSAAEGGPLPFASKWKATATGTYTLPLPDTVGKVEFGLSYIFDSGYQVIDPAVSPYYKTPKLNLVNLNLNWSHIAGSPVDVSLFATNLFDRTYWTQILNTYNDPFIGGWEGRVLGQPRMFGARIKYRFGR